MHIATQFDDEHAEKLAFIQQQTQQEIAEILNRAIDLYYQQLQVPEKSPLEIFEEVGLVGCIDAEPDLSSNYKPVVKQYLHNNHS